MARLSSSSASRPSLLPLPRPRRRRTSLRRPSPSRTPRRPRTSRTASRRHRRATLTPRHRRPRSTTRTASRSSSSSSSSTASRRTEGPRRRRSRRGRRRGRTRRARGETVDVEEEEQVPRRGSGACEARCSCNEVVGLALCLSVRPRAAFLRARELLVARLVQLGSPCPRASRGFCRVYLCALSSATCLRAQESSACSAQAGRDEPLNRRRRR